MQRKFSYGRVKDQQDDRDFKFKMERLAPLKSVYLNPDSGYKLPPVWDQGDLGSCTAYAWAFAVIFDLLNKDRQNDYPVSYTPSELFIYYMERKSAGDLPNDSGAQIRDGAKVLNKYGVCDRTIYTSDNSQFNLLPDTNVLNNALKYKALSYESLDNSNKALLVNTLMLGFPIVFGMDCYESFESDTVNRTSIVPFPKSSEIVIGGHAMAIVGYHMGKGDDDTFIVRNSWGKDWGGHGGYLRIPTRYLCDKSMASDFWKLTSVL